MKDGTVFDIQRFALHDGPGIRTTVFLKGCPLRCAWCHNPESQSRVKEYSFHYEKCVQCLKSGHVCESGVRFASQSDSSLSSSKKIDALGEVLIHDRTVINESCVESCPYHAIKVVGEIMNVEDILHEVMKDQDYYVASGGGMTISGGEPMVQFELVKQLAMEAKKQDVHTCLDTSGYAPQKQYAEIAPYIDLFLFDYKATDASLHAKLTGVSNEQILSNLKFLSEIGASIILRCPLIPGINDSEEHLQGIARVAREIPSLIALNIMAYHDMGVYKATEIGNPSPLQQIKTADEQMKAGWLNTLKALGCQNVSFG